MSALEQLDLVGAADAIQAKQISSSELTEWSLSRLESIGHRFNAIFRIDRETAIVRARALDEMQARGRLSGPLHGVPMAHKDMFQVSGRECHAGSKILRGNIAGRTAFVISELDRAGQVNLGSLHMAEFALSPTGYNGHYGSGRNPWDEAYICGGSSSGSGIAVAARLVFGSLGGDTAGSIRLPAALCGVTGIKPTFRRVSADASVPLAFSLDCVGPLAQSARDCARLLTHISRPNPEDGLCTQIPGSDYEAGLDGDLRGLRIGVPDEYFRADIDPRVAACLDASLAVLAARGAAIVPAAAPDMPTINALAQLVLSVEAAALHRRWVEQRPEDYAEQVRSRIEPGFAYPAVRYAEALAIRKKIVDEFLRSAFADCDVLHVPTVPIATPTIADTTEGDLQHILGRLGRVNSATRGINYLGLPAMSVPVGFLESKLPVGLQLVGRPFEEATLLKVADAYQRDTRWHRAIPPVG